MIQKELADYTTFRDLVTSVANKNTNQSMVFVQRTDDSGKFIQVCYVLRDSNGQDMYMPNPLSMLPWEIQEDNLDSFTLEYLASELPFLWVENMIQEGHSVRIDKTTKYD